MLKKKNKVKNVCHRHIKTLKTVYDTLDFSFCNNESISSVENAHAHTTDRQIEFFPSEKKKLYIESRNSKLRLSSVSMCMQLARDNNVIVSACVVNVSSGEP